MARAVLASLRTLGVALCLAALSGCGEAAPDPPSTPAGGAGDPGGAAGRTPTYEQSFVFARVADDSVFLVPWLIRTTEAGEEVIRDARGWIGRSGTWDAFYAERWAAPTTRPPARLLPFGDMSFLVEEGDVVDGIIFDDGTRRLELALGEALSAWGGPRGEAIELVEGEAYLSDERVEGIILHLARASTGAAVPGGDWGLLISGDSLRLVLSADSEHGGEEDPLYRAWARLEDEELQWPAVMVEWSDEQAFPPARRDVPVAWSIYSIDESFEGELEAVSAEIQPGEGPGPLLPVRALFEVTGRVFVSGEEYPVRGLFVHERR